MLFVVKDFLSQHLFIPENVPFRWQGLEGTLFIPTGQKFKIEPNLQKILYHKKHSNDSPNYRHRSGIYVFKESGELVCLDCNEIKTEKHTSSTKISINI